jgi:hypothetical protein
MTVSLLPRGDVPQAWTETLIRYGSSHGPAEILYYCFYCANDPKIEIPEENTVIARKRGEDELALPGIF